MALSVGVVGLGAMGRPAAQLLAAVGHDTYSYDRDPSVIAEGVKPTASLAELGAHSDIVLVVVPSDDDVLQVCSRADGVLASSRPGTVLLICSSVTPDTCRSVASSAAPLGVDVLDAGLVGGVRAAEAGAVTLLVGGEVGVLERIRSVLEPWTASVHLLGPLGSGQVGKTVNNLCHWGQLSVIVEALRLGQALGVEPGLLRAAVLDGPAASRTMAEMELMRLAWPAKDLANAMQMAASVAVPMPLAHAVRSAMTSLSVADIAALYNRDQADRD